MLTKITNKLFKLSCNLIVLQLLLMPIASARVIDKVATESNFEIAADVIMGGATALTQGMNAYMQSNSQMNNSQYEMHRQTLNPILALTPIEANLISPIFAGCAVLPASAPLLGGNMSCQKADPNTMKSGYGNAVIDIATLNIKQLENYQVSGHDTFNAQGIGCYNRALKNFNTTLLEREKAIDAKIKFFEEQLDQFKFNSKKDLDEIKKRTANLTGKPAQYLEKDVNLEDQLTSSLNDPNNVCASVMSSKKFQDSAKGGLEGLLKGVENVAVTPVGSGGLTAQGLLDKASALSSDIDRISNIVSQTTAGNSEFKASTDGMNFKSSLITKNNAALEKVISEYNTDISTKTKQIQKKLGVTKKSLTDDPIIKNIITGIENDNIDVSARISDYQKRTKQACITKVIQSNFKDTRSLGRRFVNPNISKSLREKADNALAIKIENLFDFSDPSNSYSIEEALKLLKKYESTGGNSDYTMLTGKSMTVNGKDLNASTRLRSSQLLEMFVDNCNQQYASSVNQDGFTGADIAKNLQSYSSQVNAMRKTAPAKIQTAIRDSLKNCAEDTTTGVSENSCSTATDTQSAGFCLRTAMTCASNMNGCVEKAQAKVTKERAEQTQYVANYNGHVDNFKKTLLAELKGMDSFISQQANTLNAQLQEGNVFDIPEMKFKLGDQQLLAAKDGITDDLQMEDPEKYLEMAKDQMNEMKKKMKDQRVAFLGNSTKGKTNFIGQGSLGSKAQNYVDNYQSQIGDWEKMIASCNTKMTQMVEAQNKINEEQKKNNETIAKACDELRAFNAAPECDKAGDLMTTVLQASRLVNTGNSQNQQVNMYAQQADQAAMDQLGAIQKGCLQKGSGGDEKSAVSAPGGAGGINPDTFCNGVTAEADNEYTELWADGGAKRTCQSYHQLKTNKVDPCKNKKTFVDNLRGSKVICTNGSDYYLAEDNEECSTKTPTYRSDNSLYNEFYDAKYKDQSIDNDTAILAKCYMADNPPSSLEKTYEYVKSYNNYKSSTVELGESIKVAACNGGANGMAGKGSWADWATQTATEAGRALGSTRH